MARKKAAGSRHSCTDAGLPVVLAAIRFRVVLGKVSKG